MFIFLLAPERNPNKQNQIRLKKKLDWDRMEIYEPNRLLSWWEFTSVFLLRPLLAIVFVLSIILFSWLVAWKTVLVHVPLVQEICGLRKKPVKPKPLTRHRLSRFYNSNPALRNSRLEKEDNSKRLSSEIVTAE